MATEVRSTGNGLRPYRLTVEQYLRMIDEGILPHNARVELLGGILVRTMARRDPQDYVVGKLAQRLRGLVPDGWLVREEKSLRIGRWSRPEPDLAVVRGPWEAYRMRTPEPGDVAWLCEVSDATYAKDRGPKWRLYAGAGLQCYTILNIPGRQLEVSSGPTGRGKLAAYATMMNYGEGDEFPIMIEGQEVGRIAVGDVLP